MSRPACVFNIADLPAEKRPRFTSTPGVASTVRLTDDATGLTRMGAHIRAIERGFMSTNRHFHTVEEEWAYVLSGRGTVRIGVLSIPVRAGHFVGFPVGPRPHHFIGESDEPLVILEGGERRPKEDAVWYPDLRRMTRGREFVEPYDEPPPEQADEHQVVHVDDLKIVSFQHDLDPSVRRQMRILHRSSGLQRQAVKWVRVAAGDRSTVFHTHDRTDEWVFVLSGRGLVRVGDTRFEAGANDFVGHPAGGPPHVMEALEEITYLMGGQIDDTDVITYPEAGFRRVGDALEPIAR